MTNPIIPGTPKDRTGSSGVVKRALREMNRRWDGLQAEVLAIFDRVQVYALNSDRVAYALTPDQMAALSAELQAAVERWIASGRDPAYSFWWSVYESEASQLGAAQTAANLANLSAAYAATRSIEAIVYSTPYQNRLAIAQLKSYEHWTGLAAAQKSELAQIIGRAVVDGKNPRNVVTEIKDRLDVSRRKAKQYAQTDITDTLRQTRMAEADDAEQSLNLRIGLLWTSALKPTTRPWHASRNGKVYSTDDVRAFYEKDGNRYNCFCACTEALLDTSGNPILSDRLKSKMIKERGEWQKANP